jgi:para-aminobenzoate synthetase component 1
LREGLDAVDLLRATFPGGSITGAPKIRAMEIIDEQEPTARSVYTGAIGYFGFDGSLDLNIAIRTILVKDGTAHFQTGGGIVADSDPEMEYRETLYKGAALARVLASGAEVAASRTSP